MTRLGAETIPEGFQGAYITLATSKTKKRLLSHYRSCECFVLPLLSLVCAKKPLEGVQPIGWRLYRKVGATILEVHIDNISDRKAHVVAKGNVGDGDLSVSESLAAIEKSGLAGSYTARLLLIPPLIPSSLWLKSSGRNSDRIVIQASNVAGILPGLIITPALLLRRLLEPARSLLEFHSEATEIPSTVATPIPDGA
jgi:hypothetical protein